MAKKAKAATTPPAADATESGGCPCPRCSIFPKSKQPLRRLYKILSHLINMAEDLFPRAKSGEAKSSWVISATKELISDLDLDERATNAFLQFAINFVLAQTRRP
jgi:hypothetical protein